MNKMNKTDLITIAIPVYERTSFFVEAIESALNQTVRCNVIVVDNFSSHNYFRDKCKEKKVSYFRNDSNIGMFPNWNKCFEFANTEFVLILGDDDVLNENYVSVFLDKLNENKNLDVFFTDFRILNNESGELRNHKHILPFGYMEQGNKIIEYGIKYRLGFPIITSAIRKSKLTGFYEEAHASNDWIWIYENASDLKIFGESKKLLKYRKHSSNDSSNNTTKLNCFISMWYLYLTIFKPFLTNEEKLCKDFNEYSRYIKMYILNNITRKQVYEIRNRKDKYAVFFTLQLNENLNYKIYLFLPIKIRKIVFSLLIRFQLIK